MVSALGAAAVIVAEPPKAMLDPLTVIEELVNKVLPTEPVLMSAMIWLPASL